MYAEEIYDVLKKELTESGIDSFDEENIQNHDEKRVKTSPKVLETSKNTKKTFKRKNGDKSNRANLARGDEKITSSLQLYENTRSCPDIS